MSPLSRSSGLPSRVLFLNDVAFQYGAGVGQARQVEAFLALGVEVGVIAWAPGKITLEKVATRAVDSSRWRGVGEVAHLDGGRELSDDAVIAGLQMEIARFRPDVVLVGNLHAARWPLRLLTAIARLGCRVIAFVHDAYLFTGRCAYPGTCRLYLTGCDATCPTATEYPPLAPALIADAWRIRRDIFGGPHGLEVVTNSRWSRAMFRAAIPTAIHLETIELGAEATVFKPGDRAAAQRHFGIPGDRPIVMCAAVNFQEERKGGRQLRAIIEALRDECTFIAFGHNAHEIPDLIGLGYHLEAHLLALAYQAADLFLGTALEEAFGQTIMEAQLCGLPVVAFHAGGVPEIVRNEITGRLVPNGDVAAAVVTVRATLADEVFMRRASTAARDFAATRFSVEAHAERWRAYFAGHRQKPTGFRPPLDAFVPPRHTAPTDPEPFAPSWPDSPSELAAQIASYTAGLQDTAGWPDIHEAAKLFEAGFHAGDTIVEIAPVDGRAALAALHGAAANPRRTLPAEYYGISHPSRRGDFDSAELLASPFSRNCHLFQGELAAFFARWQIKPTLIVLDGAGREKESIRADLELISTHAAAGTLVLLRDFIAPAEKLRKPAARAAGETWETTGRAVFAGCFGRAALYTLRNATA